MMRQYTDPRFPGIHIENHGTFKFFVVDGGKIIHTFTAYEDPRDRHVSEEFARRRANDYFERMGKMNLSGELEAQNWGSREPKAAPLMKVRPPDVESAMAAARAETDPVRKKALEQRAMDLMAQEESLAEQVVRHLLYER